MGEARKNGSRTDLAANRLDDVDGGRQPISHSIAMATTIPTPTGPLKLLREELGPLLESHGADIVLAGHDHTYQRSYLIDGHYGTREQFASAKHLKSVSDGRKTPMKKKPGPNGGTIYVVSGTGGGSRPGGGFAHPVMVSARRGKGWQGQGAEGFRDREVSF